MLQVESWVFGLKLCSHSLNPTSLSAPAIPEETSCTRLWDPDLYLEDFQVPVARFFWLEMIPCPPFPTIKSLFRVSEQHFSKKWPPAASGHFLPASGMVHFFSRPACIFFFLDRSHVTIDTKKNPPSKFSMHHTQDERTETRDERGSLSQKKFFPNPEQRLDSWKGCTWYHF